MYSFRNITIAVGLLALAPHLGHAQGSRSPYAGYAYPAGGQRGTTFQIVVGGRNLKRTKAILVSGTGVTATVEKYVKPTRNTEMREQRKEAKQRLKAEIKSKRGTAEDPVQEMDLTSAAEAMSALEWSHNPYYADFSKMTLHELRQVSQNFRMKMRQVNRQLADVVVLNVTIAPDAKPGYRELRLVGKAAMTNPLRFHVDSLPELRESEPNDPEVKTRTVASIPAVINGQIMPGDVDRFKFKAVKGQQLVVDLHARRVIPYLADAVPGWFQATVSIFDESGKELAFVDDYEFNPDPVAFFTVPESGDYLVEVKDAIYRGREDFVYRLRIGELPFITGMFPLGGHQGDEVTVTLLGVNLPSHEVALKPDTEGALGEVRLWKGTFSSNPVTYRSTEMPNVNEAKLNDTIERAQKIALPHTVNGRIEASGDVDVFAVSGKKGETIVAEVFARRLGSSLDSLVQVTDEAGKVLAWNDDFKRRNLGYLTHLADSYLTFTLPADGTYYVHLRDARGKGGTSYAYLMRLSNPTPGFAVYVSPSGISVPAGKTVPVQATVIRWDGFDGPVKVALKEGAGFKLGGDVVPAGVDRVEMTLTSPQTGKRTPQPIAFEATAIVRGRLVSVPCQPSDDVMQAFLWRHLVESEKQLALVSPMGRWLPTYRLDNQENLILKPGARITLRALASRPVKEGEVVLSLRNPPKGVHLEDVKFNPRRIDFTIVVHPNAKLVGAGNLIVQATGTFPAKAKGRKKPDPKGKKRTWTVPLGAIPAIPYVVQ